MLAIETWLAENGRQGRQKLLEALQVHNPSFSRQRLFNYLRGKRIPDFTTAQIISEVTQVPLADLPYRLVNDPGNKHSV